MADITIHPSSVETVYIPVRDEHPYSGDVDLSALAVEVALPAAGAAPTTWVTTAWESGTARINGKRYHMARLRLGVDFTITNGSTYQAWARVTTSGSNKAYVSGGRIIAQSAL